MSKPRKISKRFSGISPKKIVSYKNASAQNPFSPVLWNRKYEKKINRVLASMPSQLQVPLEDLIAVLWGAPPHTDKYRPALARSRSLPKDSEYARKFDMALDSVLKTILFYYPDPQVRRGAIRSLVGNVLHSAAAAEKPNVERHVTTLLKALKDPSLNVSREAALALARVRDKRAVPVLGRVVKEWGSRDAIKALAYIGGKEVFKSLVDGLRDRHSWSRSEAIKGLEKIGLKEAIKYLQWVASNDKVSRVREEAQAAIKKIEEEPK